MDRPFLKIAANDKYDRMVGIQITERRFKIFYPSTKEPTVLYNGLETYCKIYGTYDISYVGHNYTFEDVPFLLHDYDYIEFEFMNKKITSQLAANLKVRALQA